MQKQGDLRETLIWGSFSQETLGSPLATMTFDLCFYCSGGGKYIPRTISAVARQQQGVGGSEECKSHLRSTRHGGGSEGRTQGPHSRGGVWSSSFLRVGAVPQHKPAPRLFDSQAGEQATNTCFDVSQE